MPTRYSIEDMRSIAAHYGGKCMSKEFIDIYAPLSWMCEKGHTWDSPYSIVRQGGWCRACLRNEEKLQEYRDFAKQKDGRCLTTEYQGAAAKAEWECAKGHRWFNVFYSLKNRKEWCNQCRIEQHREKRLHELRQIAKQRGGKCLSDIYINPYSKLKWQCGKGHIWISDAHTVKNHNTWCPECYGNVKNTIEQMQQLAAEYGGQCLSKKYEDNKTKLQWRCSKGHVWKARPEEVKVAGRWCFICAGGVRHTLKEMKEIANKRGGKCLSLKYVSVNEKLVWQCSEGHQWKAMPQNILKGQWCSVCVNKRNGIRQRTDIKEIRKLAVTRRGKLISEDYINNHAPLLWKCDKGHEWKAAASNIKQGQWCPVCAWDIRRVKISIAAKARFRKLKIPK